MSEMLDRLEAVIREAFKDEEAFVSQIDVIWVRGESFGFRPRVLAKSMLKAMREPTKTMKTAAYKECGTTDLSSEEDFEECYGGVWEAMIDEALSP